MVKPDEDWAMGQRITECASGRGCLGDRGGDEDKEDREQNVESVRTDDSRSLLGKGSER